MTQTVVDCSIDLVTGNGTMTIKTTVDGVDTYSTKDIALSTENKNSIEAILMTYVQE